MTTSAAALDERRLPGTENYAHTRFWWVRHAPVTSDEGKIYGQRDLPGDTHEAYKYAALAQALPTGAHWIVTSLRRTRDTAHGLDTLLVPGDARQVPLLGPAAIAVHDDRDMARRTCRGCCVCRQIDPSCPPRAD